MATVTPPPPPPTPTRRTVLRALGAGGAVLAVAGLGGLSYRVYDTAVLAPNRGAAHDPWREWRDVPGPLGAVAAAVLAASPHNTQPWTFAVSDDAIDVFVDRSRGTGAVDPLRREQSVGLGCALENLVRAAAVRGLGPAVTLLPDGQAADRVARVDLTGGATLRDPLYEAIGNRHTNRGPYADRPVPPDVLAALVGPTDLPGPSVHWITAPEPRAELGRLLVDASAALIADDEQSRDGFVWFRSHDDDVQRYRDGLVLDGQGLSPLVLGAAKLLPPSSRTDGDRFWLDQTRTVHAATAAAYGVITAATPDDRATQLTAGRLLQGIHLAATDRGLALQHMNQITERIDREATTGVSPTFAPRFAALLPAGGTPLLTFRVGHPERYAGPTPRRGTSDVLR
jgi:hypothetical protein